MAQNCEPFNVWFVLETDIRGVRWTDPSSIEHIHDRFINDQTV